MPASVFKSAAAATLCLALAAGCARIEPKDPRQPVLENYAQIVLATYEDTITTARALDQAVDALLANPSEETLNTARERWRAARIPYAYSEAFRFYAGPIDSEHGPEGQLNGWPLDENHIDAVALDKYNAAPGLNIVGDAKTFPEITPELIAEQNELGGEKNIASGYHAVEFLLWGQDWNNPPDSAGQRPYTDFVPKSDDPADVNARRGKYLKAATTLIISDLEAVAAQWRESKEPNYRTTFVNGDVYTGLKHMFTGAAALSEVEMAGERMNVPLLSSDQEEEQSCFSDMTADELRANAQGIENVYFGRYTRLDGTTLSGPSLADLVKAKDARAAEEIEARLARTRETVGAVKNPFDREILADNVEGRARMQAAIDSLRAQALSISRGARSIEVFLSDLQGLGD
ncbi:imelysin family protein [Peristeroidobacter soli]|jgi:putative iron-regulated protein|uniref:imelysin family protein n=1 Tax=Peristeroidobacter soli TaxID=2497877 RepID=UPI00101B74E3|nr:imelysin family protein [Peristeroidobacter soli]